MLLSVCEYVYLWVCLQGGPKKNTLHFVFSVKFVVFNIFSKFLRHIVAKYQEILPCKFQVCTTKTIYLQGLSTVTSLNLQNTLKTNPEIGYLTINERCGVRCCKTILKFIGFNLLIFSNNIAKKLLKIFKI